MRELCCCLWCETLIELDCNRIEGEAINKLILDAETEDMKKKWMDTLVAAKLQDAPMEGPMRFEVGPHGLGFHLKWLSRCGAADSAQDEEVDQRRLGYQVRQE